MGCGLEFGLMLERGPLAGVDCFAGLGVLHRLEVVISPSASPEQILFFLEGEVVRMALRFCP